MDAEITGTVMPRLSSDNFAKIQHIMKCKLNKEQELRLQRIRDDLSEYWISWDQNPVCYHLVVNEIKKIEEFFGEAQKYLLKMQDAYNSENKNFKCAVSHLSTQHIHRTGQPEWNLLPLWRQMDTLRQSAIDARESIRPGESVKSKNPRHYLSPFFLHLAGFVEEAQYRVSPNAGSRFEHLARHLFDKFPEKLRKIALNGAQDADFEKILLGWVKGRYRRWKPKTAQISDGVAK